MQDVRWEPRESKNGLYSLNWKGPDGRTRSSEGRGLDASKSGVGLECTCEFKPGSIVYLEARDGSLQGDCVVVHCTKIAGKYHVGFEFREQAAAEQEQPKAAAANKPEEIDYYDVLQISPKAEIQTIHRVFRMMAVRFHPDNPETGDVEEFLRLKKAYAVLSDPERRAEYDAQRQLRQDAPMPIFGLKDFVTGVEAESNRRLGVLSLLYNRRRTVPDNPGVSLLDLEQQMGFPREHLTFTLWYLRAKEYVSVADNSDYALTASGADYVEKKAARNEILCRLLKPGGSRVRPVTRPNKARTEQGAKQRFLLGPSLAKEP